MKRLLQLTWPAVAVADALGISVSDYLCPLRYDGRYATGTVTYLLMGRGLTAVENKTGHLFVFDSDDDDKKYLRYKPRCVTGNGIDFNPSYCRGLGRSQSKAKHEHGLDEVDGFVVFFAFDLPDATIWLVTTEDVRHWTASKHLTACGHGSYTTMRGLLV